MMNESNIVCLKFYQNQFMCIYLVFHLKTFIYLFKIASITFLSYILFELLDVEYGSLISQENVKSNSLGLALAIVPTSPKGGFCTL